MAEERRGEDGVWPENVTPVCAFLVSTTQWRTAQLEGRIVCLGLDYAGVRAGLEGAGVEITPELWGDLQVMEAAAVAALRGRRG
nr:DUF1799 domain-containing protein [Maritimibacter sp. 55A14]